MTGDAYAPSQGQALPDLAVCAVMGHHALVHRLTWRSLSIQEGTDGPALVGAKKLAALFMFLREEAPPHFIVRAADGSIVTDPLAVNWANFPLQDAIEAAKAHRQDLMKGRS